VIYIALFMQKVVLSIYAFCFSTLLWASPPDSTLHSLFSVGASYHRGFIFAHSTDVQNTAGSYPWGIQLDFNWQKRNQQTWDNCYCYPRTGVVVQYFNYDNAVLGSSLNVAAYIEPYFNYRQKLNVSLKAFAGLSYLTNPFDSTENPTNMSYSLPVSGYIALGFGLHYRVSPKINLHLYGNYNHISNGGIKDPNKGINWPTASIGIDYAFEPYYMPAREKTRNKNFKNKPIRFETGVFATSKTVQNGEKQRWMIGGVYGHAAKQVSLINALNMGAEIWYDASLAEKMRRAGDTTTSAWRAGIPLGNEFLMGKFVFSQQIGIYLYNPSGNFPAIYQRYGLMYQPGNRFSFGINLLAHAQVANFLDFRLGYNW
jgi:hypothetical protein